MSSFKEQAEKLVNNGYLIVPIHAGTKAPKIKDWQKRTFTPSDIVAGVGVKCGIGDFPICAIDIDVLDESIAQQVVNFCHDNFGYTVERVGQPPKILLPYRASEANWKKQTSKKFGDNNFQIEILGQGQQFVAYAIHPKTNKPYDYTDVLGGLEDIKASELPVITLNQVADVIAYFEQLCIGAGLPAQSGQTSQKSDSKAHTSKAIISDDDDFTKGQPIDISLEQVENCLACISDNVTRDNWLKVGMILHHQFSGDSEGLDLWDRWSETAPNYQSYEDLKKTWDSFSHGKKAPVTARTLLDMAKQANPARYFSTLEDWQQPQPIRQTLPPVKDITPEMLPPCLYDFTTDNANRLSVPKVYIAIPLVVAMGSVIGAKIGIMPKVNDDWQEVANLWGGIIGDPSTKKSPSLNTALEPLRALEQKAKADYEKALKDHTAQTLINKATETALKKQLDNAVNSKAKKTDESDTPASDEQIKAIADKLAEKQTQTPPTIRRYIADDSTHEKLGELESQNTNGILVNRDELTGLFKYLDKPDNEQARTFYLEGYNGKGNKTFDRITRGTLFIENHCLSVLGTIQPETIEQYLQRLNDFGNDGLIQRFSLLVYPDRLTDNKEKDLPVNKAISEQVQMIFDRLDSLDDWELSEHGLNINGKRAIIRLDEHAYPVFMAWLDSLIAHENDFEHGILKQHITKYRKTLLALLIVFHLIECITKNSTDWRNVSLATLEQGIAFINMLESHMIRIYTPITDKAQSKAGALATRLLKIINDPARSGELAKWLNDGFTIRQIYRREWQGLKNADDVQTALDILIENHWLNWVSEQTTGQGGRPTERYFINPLLFDFKN